MSYSEDIAIALIRVLDHAVLHKGVRLSGYVANIDFWAKEIRHCLDTLAGYEARFERLKATRIRFAQDRSMEVQTEWITRSMTADELDRVGKRLHASAAQFLRGCKPLLERSKVIELETLTGIRIEDPRVRD